MAPWLDRTSGLLVAASLHGRPRVTKGVDVVVIAEDDEWVPLLKRAAKWRLVPRVDDALEFAKTTRVLLMKHEPTRIEVDVSFGNEPAIARYPARPSGIVSRNSRLTMSPNGRILAVEWAGATTVWNVARRKALLSVNSDSGFTGARRGAAVRFSKDGRWAAVVATDAEFAHGAVVLVDLEVDTATVFEGCDPHALEFSPEGSRLAVGSRLYACGFDVEKKTLFWKTPDLRPKGNAAVEEIPWHIDVAELAFFGGRSQLYVLLEDGEAALFDIDSRARRALPSALANREEAPILDDELSKRMSQHVCSMGGYTWPLRMCEGG